MLIYQYRDNKEHLALVNGDVYGKENILVASIPNALPTSWDRGAATAASSSIIPCS